MVEQLKRRGFYPNSEKKLLLRLGEEVGEVFEDFNSEKDKGVLQEYVEKFSIDKGIMLSRHRLVMVVQKISLRFS